MSVSSIGEVEERLRDLIEVLHEAGCASHVAALASHTRDFTVQTRVRRSVNEIRRQLEYWREHPDELPDSPKIMLAANRLEDVCKEALAAGVIASARLSFAAQVRRKAIIALVTLAVGLVVVLIPFGLVRAGFDPMEMRQSYRLGMRRLPRGEEDSFEVFAVEHALLPDAVRSAEFGPRGHCKQKLPGDALCMQVTERLWAEGRLPTFEIKLPHQTYGLLFSITRSRMSHNVASADILFAATDETPEGHYELPLAATYFGYTPQACTWLQRLEAQCKAPRRGKGERHLEARGPVAVIEVVAGDPNRRLGEKRRAQAEAEEIKRRAEERARQIGAALSEIDIILKQTSKLVAQHKWEQVRERVGKLGSLFEPLEAAAVSHTDSETLPQAINDVRTRFEQLRDKLDGFEGRVFERMFVVVTAETSRNVAEDKLLGQIAAQFGVPKEFVQAIYTERADEIERRLHAREQARIDALKAEQAALERHCGPLPVSGWSAVSKYAQRIFDEPNVEIQLGECMTPRLTRKDCWVMHCEYVHKREISVEKPVVVTRREADFFFSQGQIVGYR